MRVCHLLGLETDRKSSGRSGGLVFLDSALLGLLAVGLVLGVFQFFYIWLTWRSERAARAKTLLDAQALYRRAIQRPLILVRKLRVKPRV